MDKNIPIIEKLFTDGRQMIPFVTTGDGISFGENEVEKNKSAQLSFEEEVSKRVEEELMKRGVVDPSEMEALSFTSLREQIFDGSSSADDTMPQITEDSRDVSPSHDSQNMEMTSQQKEALPIKTMAKMQKTGRTMDSQERDSKEKGREDLAAGVRSTAGRDTPNEEKAVIQDAAVREAREARVEEKQDRAKLTQEKPPAHARIATKERSEQKQEKEKAPRIRIEHQVVAKETETLRSNDHEGHDVKKETEKVKAKAVNMDRGPGFGGLAASLARGQEDTKANNLMMNAVDITSRTGRTTEFLQGNDKLQMRRDPTDGCTYAYINDKKVSADQAKSFIVGMNRALGSEKAEQLRSIVERAKSEPMLDKKGREQTVHKDNGHEVGRS